MTRVDRLEAELEIERAYQTLTDDLTAAKSAYSAKPSDKTKTAKNEAATAVAEFRTYLRTLAGRTGTHATGGE